MREIIIRCHSHRSREKMNRVLGKIKEYYNFRDRGHFNKITPEQWEQIKHITGIKKARPKHELMECW